ncbi:hypothetical protein ABZY68_25470 [Streptomyces sp. NPDC006482]
MSDPASTTEGDYMLVRLFGIKGTLKIGVVFVVGVMVYRWAKG